ncbi:MAG: OPT/YSL family transporter, partial [Atopobiaceae bacterium]|nr:OPT/YSL family transporter [Atopobiaceae bacterium]
PAVVLGVAAGIVLYCLGLPSMMIGLGVYLPFYMSLSAPIGALVKLAYDKFLGGKEETGELGHDDTGVIVASGLLGGESIVGVAIALMTVVTGLMG